MFTNEQTLDTEETWVFKVLSDGHLYVPEIDPQGTNDPTKGMYAVATAAGAWTVVTSVTPGPEHVMDVDLADGALWLSGSAYEGELAPSLGGVASVWKSTDGGSTWTRDLAIATDTGGARFYALLRVADGLVAVMSDTGPTRAWHRPNGGTWTEVDATPYDGAQESIPYGAGSFALHGSQKLAVPPFGASGHGGPTGPPGNTYAIATAGTNAYALDTDGKVRKTTDGTTWTHIFTVNDATARSIAVDEAGDYAYFGTTDSRVIRAALP